MYKTIIIDDQPDSIEDLQLLISKYSLPIEVIATATTGAEGLAAILKHKPQLVFTDVVMPGMSGFEMLELLPKIDFGLIITTAFNKYAVQAIRVSALDFLLKPIIVSELKAAIERFQKNFEIPSKNQIDLLSEHMRERNKPLKKIALTISDGIQLVQLDDILYFESDGNYTSVFLTNASTVLVSKPIGKFEEATTGGNFFRIHNSFLVNLNHIKKYSRSDGGYVVLESGKSLSVSRSKKEELLEALTNI